MTVCHIKQTCPPNPVTVCENKQTRPPNPVTVCGNKQTCPSNPVTVCENKQTCPSNPVTVCENKQTCPPNPVTVCENKQTCPPNPVTVCENKQTCPPNPAPGVCLPLSASSSEKCMRTFNNPGANVIVVLVGRIVCYTRRDVCFRHFVYSFSIAFDVMTALKSLGSPLPAVVRLGRPLSAVVRQLAPRAWCPLQCLLAKTVGVLSSSVRAEGPGFESR